MAPVRNILDSEESTIRKQVLEMSAMADTAIDRAMQSLQRMDHALAREVMRNDDTVNERQRRIEEDCLSVVATQQPVASDLRLLLAAVHIVDELERIADHAADIADIVTQMDNRTPPTPLHNLERMADGVRSMLDKVMGAFVEHDADLARIVATEDEAVDQLQQRMCDELFAYMTQDSGKIKCGTYLLWICHNLERIGDRVTNIAERVIFMTNGRILDLNR